MQKDEDSDETALGAGLKAGYARKSPFLDNPGWEDQKDWDRGCEQGYVLYSIDKRLLCIDNLNNKVIPWRLSRVSKLAAKQNELQLKKLGRW